MLLQHLASTFESVDDGPLPVLRRKRGVRTAEALGPVAIPLCARELVHGTAPRARWAAMLLRHLARAGHQNKVRGALEQATHGVGVTERGVRRAAQVVAQLDTPRPIHIRPAESVSSPKRPTDHRSQAAARAELGLRDLALGRGNDASEHLQSAVALEPDNPDHLWNLAAAQNRGGCDGTRYLALTSFLACAAPSSRRAAIAREMILDYERAVRLRYGDADPAVVASADQQCARGQRFIADGAPARAIAWLEGAVATAPEHAVAWTELGLAHRALGHTNAAIQALRRAVQLHSPDPRARRALAELAPADATVG